jgi:hypothetical protein
MDSETPRARRTARHFIETVDHALAALEQMKKARAALHRHASIGLSMDGLDTSDADVTDNDEGR